MNGPDKPSLPASSIGQNDQRTAPIEHAGGVLEVSARGLHVGMRVRWNANGVVYRCKRIKGESAWLEPTIHGTRAARRNAARLARKGGA